MSSARQQEHGFSSCQDAAYAECLSSYSAAGYEWFGNWDVDEYVFVNLIGGSTTIDKSSATDKSSASDFWSLVEGLGDSIQLQCLKFGPRRVDKSTFEGDPYKHLWRAPYKHMGDRDAIQ